MYRSMYRSCTGQAEDDCFALFGAHHCGALADMHGRLTAYVSTTVALLRELHVSILAGEGPK